MEPLANLSQSKVATWIAPKRAACTNCVAGEHRHVDARIRIQRECVRERDAYAQGTHLSGISYIQRTPQRALWYPDELWRAAEEKANALHEDYI